VLDLGYIVATVLFVFGLKDLSRVRTARRGNQLAALGMLVAVVVALAGAEKVSWTLLGAGLVLGAAVGAWLARRVEMTAMPEMVALFNGLGGFASLFVVLAQFWNDYLLSAVEVQGEAATQPVTLAENPNFFPVGAVTVFLTVLVGAVTFTGSLVAVGKLSGRIPGKPILLPVRHLLNAALGVAVLLLGWLLAFETSGWLTATLLIFVALLSAALGILLVIPIGGADMPVVISLLNSYSGIAASMAGFVLGQQLLIVCGALVGASGLILTRLMCKAMNRSLANVLIGGFGDTGGGGDQSEYENVRSASAEEAAMILESAGSVIIVPGYGMAVAQAQHVVKELADLLERHGAQVRFAIHPVAGRMPGHMNVLLAEADVDYDKLWELERINNDFASTDVALVIGANDVVNPAAIEDPESPIAGMPILNVHEAGTVLVVKRSLSPGYAGIKNPLFERDNCLMGFGDGKQFLTEVVNELKEAG